MKRAGAAATLVTALFASSTGRTCDLGPGPRPERVHADVLTPTAVVGWIFDRAGGLVFGLDASLARHTTQGTIGLHAHALAVNDPIGPGRAAQVGGGVLASPWGVDRRASDPCDEVSLYRGLSPVGRFGLAHRTGNWEMDPTTFAQAGVAVSYAWFGAITFGLPLRSTRSFGLQVALTAGFGLPFVIGESTALR